MNNISVKLFDNGKEICEVKINKKQFNKGIHSKEKYIECMVARISTHLSEVYDEYLGNERFDASI